APLADRGEVASMLIMEGQRRGCAAEPGPDDVGDVGPLLLGGWRDAGNLLPIWTEDNRCVADRENLRMVRDGQVGFSFEPSNPVRRSVEPLGGGRRLNAGGPKDCRCRQSLAAEDDPVGVAFRNWLPKHDLDAQLLQRILGVV